MKYTYAIDTKELQEFTHNNFIYNLAKDLCIKANKENKINTFTLLSLDYLDDLKEEEKEGYIEILEIIYK